MSWIQNFIQKFIKDKQDEYAEYEIHKKPLERPLPHKINEGSYHLDTKISYQYPKGKREQLNVQPEVPTVIPKKNIRSKKFEQGADGKGSEIRSSTISSSDSRSRTEANKISPPIKKKPFQLTEIPSPIYGFKRPDKSSDRIVEHELSRFLMDESNKLLVSIIQESEPAPMPEMELAESEPAVTESEPAVAVSEPAVAASEPAVAVSELAVAVTEPTVAAFEEIKDNEDFPVNDPKPVEKTDESSGAPTRKRSHLPFNVMMLKQDKVKWEERKRKSLLDDKEKVKEETPELKRKPDNLEDSLEIIEDLPKVEVLAKNPVTVQPELKVESVPASHIVMEESIVESEIGLYEFPKMNLLKPPVIVEDDTEWLLYQEELLNQTLQNFNVGASVVNVTQGPAVTRFEVQPEPGVKVNKITNLSDDIKLSLAAKDIRIEAPIPGKHTIGIEVPNQKSRPVLINEIIQSQVFRESASPLTAVLGLDISGKPIVTDLKKMPHGLIAGATGSGKSVCINTILVSLLFKASPEDLKLLLIDPKMVELAPYNRIPHLVSPVITDVKAATASLKWAVEEMERRYELFAHSGVRDINRFNELAIKHKQYSDKLPFIVIIIDELADLMMVSPADVEEAICRIAQKARACGIHLIVATQRPSVDVITGLIKANIPTRISFSVSSQVDSRTIIDISGAEKLLGRGDMLFLENGSSKPVRLQGTFVSDEEIDLVVEHVRNQREPDYLFQQEELLKKTQVTEDEDELFYEACEFIIEQGLASTSSLQRRFKIGYNRAARLMDMLESNGFITSANGSKPREVLITLEDLESLQDTGSMN
ncbi:DNA translocase FtsK [Neobacillus sp. DY30]|uniref:DNA translocase FtsK n=1 Tax=Neobacillus sp. DY30 TaxID=3047871 RepID=UPI0024BFB70A|nr:DNA translocase FtsK [Neobacillus sp. DY30]WHX99641.1 DNA translocase FtsK [Neobacillus sp. DY30]